MSKTREQVLSELNAKIPRDAVMQREGGGGKSFSYLAGHYVIARLNEVLGQGNWGYETDEIRCVHTGEAPRGGFTAHYIARVRLTLVLPTQSAETYPSGTSFSDVGYGDGSDKMSPGKCHELAAKEAVTDALKRCAKNLGMSMGLALYDKEQTNVDDGEEKAPALKAVSHSPKAASGPIGVGRVRSSSDETVPSGDPKANGKAVTKEPPAERDQVNQMISEMSRVVTQKRIKDVAALKGEMKTRYGTDTKEKLDDTQAKDLYGYLQGLLN